MTTDLTMKCSLSWCTRSAQWALRRPFNMDGDEDWPDATAFACDEHLGSVGKALNYEGGCVITQIEEQQS